MGAKVDAVIKEIKGVGTAVKEVDEGLKGVGEVIKGVDEATEKLPLSNDAPWCEVGSEVGLHER